MSDVQDIVERLECTERLARCSGYSFIADELTRDIPTIRQLLADNAALQAKVDEAMEALRYAVQCIEETDLHGENDMLRDALSAAYTALSNLKAGTPK